jgi:hypothetical protein
MRFESRSKTMPALAEHINEMATIVERRRKSHGSETTERHEETRRLRECVVVMVWEEEDGSETISVLGDAELDDLELKGVLHDGLYAMTQNTRSTSER